MKLKLEIYPNEGYGHDQIRHTMTVQELKTLLGYYEDDDEIVTFDLNNQYGAKWGYIGGLEEIEED